MMLRLLVVFLVFFDFSAPSFATAPTYLQILLDQARVLQLAKKPEWLELLHYKPRLLLSGVKSLVDDPEFFNALVDGKTDPQAELVATLSNFFSTAHNKKDGQTAQCMFIARYHWLKQQLHFNAQRLPEQTCPQFEKWRKALDAKSVTLVFPVGYLNNPASMFGHTFLRIDAHGQNAHTRLLAYSVNYAAATDETNGFLFAAKGVFGGYAGVFSVVPYYDKVNEYSDIENRDIWEYQLNLTSSEVERLLEHVWELGHTWFRYYFFHENCSYNLLSLLDVVRPQMKLTDSFRWFAIPSETVRAVTHVPGLIGKVVYRPARSTILRYRLGQMPVDEQYLARDLVQNRVDTRTSLQGQRMQILEPVEQAHVLDLAYGYLDYQRLTGERKGKRMASRLLALLGARSRLKVNDPPLKVPQPGVRPDEGHQSGRVSLGFGQRAGQTYEEFRLRPAYHALMDPPGGYVRGAQINFLDIRLRRYQGAGPATPDRLRLETFTLLNIMSLTPRNLLFKSLSWHLNLGACRTLLRDNDDELLSCFSGGTGVTYALGHSTLVYGFINSALESGRHLEYHYAMGMGPALCMITDFTPRWRMQMSAGVLRYGVGDKHTEAVIDLKQRITLGPQSALQLTLMHKRAFSNDWNSAELGLNLYF